MTRESLNHPYVARVKLTHRTALPMREHWKEVVQEPAVVGSVPLGPECEEANASLSCTTRFLCCLEEDLFPIHFDFTVDSDGDYLHPHSLSQTITHTLQLGDQQPSFTPITQVLALPEERDPNNDTPTPGPPAPTLLPSQQLLHQPSLDQWLEQGVFWENTKGRERNQSRRKLQKRRGLVSSISVRSTNRKTIAPPPLLVTMTTSLGIFKDTMQIHFFFVPLVLFQIFFTPI